MDIYDGHNYYLKIRVDIYTSMDMIMAEYGIFTRYFT